VASQTWLVIVSAITVHSRLVVRVLSNKNLVVAVLAAPVLALLGWWAVGAFTGEKPQSAQEGRTYPLLEKSNCRWASGSCDLENVDFRLVLTYEEDDSGHYLAVRASHTLKGILVTVGPLENELFPAAMTAIGEQGTQWRMAVGGRPEAQARIRLVARSSGSTWFGDASAKFLQPEVVGYR
jgi:hypothetical protein